MKIHLKRLNDNYHFETVNERGNVVQLDNKSEPEPKGGKSNGAAADGNSRLQRN